MCNGPFGEARPAPAHCLRHQQLFVASCPQCIVDTIKGLLTDEWLREYLLREHDARVDPTTIQLVLDVLNQKLGIS